MKLINHNSVDSSVFDTNQNLSINQENDLNPNLNLIKDDIWDHELFINYDLNKILIKKQYLFIDADIWDAEKHEIVLRDKSKHFNQKHNQEMSKKLNKYQHKAFNYKFTKDSILFESQNINNKIQILSEKNNDMMMIKKPNINDLNKESFFQITQEPNNNFFTALACLINSDRMFETNSLRRILYPQMNNFPCVSFENVYFVKLYLNGIRRNIPVNGRFDAFVQYTIHNEYYPLFIQKALKSVYMNEEINKVLPNLLLYRLIGWIPETLLFEDIGTCDDSFDILKDQYTAFSVMLSFDFGEFILPILNFSEKFNKNAIQTILPNCLEKDNHFQNSYIMRSNFLISRV